jgi:hypothetical protein
MEFDLNEADGYRQKIETVKVNNLNNLLNVVEYVVYVVKFDYHNHQQLIDRN